MFQELERIPGNEAWMIVSVQALHRFYLRNNDKVVASWMTRQDRDVAIADNVKYINRAVGEILAIKPGGPLVFVGFSQGVAMAYRAAVLGEQRAAAVIAVGGDLPPELKTAARDHFPFIFIAAGDSDYFYTNERVQADAAFLQTQGIPNEVFRYRGGHEWTEELRQRLHQVLSRFGG